MEKEITDTGAAEEEIPQEEVEEEVAEKMSDEEADIFAKLGIEPVVEEEVEEVAEEEITEEEPVEKEKYSKRVKTRIDDLTKNWRETERERDDALKKIAELEAGKSQEAIAEPEPPKTESKTAELGIALAEAKKERKQARRDFDDDKIDELDDKIDALKDMILDEKYKQPAPENITKMVQEQQMKISYDNAAKDFSSKNKWFRTLNDDGTANKLYHNEKSIMAMNLNNEIAPTFKGTPHELFEEITKRVNEAHPTAQPKKKLSAVGGVHSINKVKRSVADINVDAASRKMLEGILGEDTAAINHVIESVQN